LYEARNMEEKRTALLPRPSSKGLFFSLPLPPRMEKGAETTLENRTLRWWNSSLINSAAGNTQLEELQVNLGADAHSPCTQGSPPMAGIPAGRDPGSEGSRALQLPVHSAPPFAPLPNNALPLRRA